MERKRSSDCWQAAKPAMGEEVMAVPDEFKNFFKQSLAAGGNT